MTGKTAADAERLTPLIGERRIRAKVRELGREISADYGGTVPVFVGILNGSFVFLADLIREVTVDCEVDFIRLSSYRGEVVGAPTVQQLGSLSRPVRGRDVLLVEDIIDTGRTLKHARRLIARRRPRSVRVVALMMKGEEPLADYVGFVVPRTFVAGYGLDDRGRMRNRKAIYRMQKAATREER